MKYIIIVLMVVISANFTSAQIKFDITRIKKSEVTKYIKVKSPNKIYLDIQYGGHEFSNNIDAKKIQNKIITKIEYIYTDFPKDFDYSQLDFKRFASLYLMFPGFFNKPWIAWEIIKQTDCKNIYESEKMFHGFVLTVKDGPEPNTISTFTPEMKAKLDQVKSSVTFKDTLTTDDLKKFLTTQEIKVTDFKLPKKMGSIKMFQQQQPGPLNIVKGLMLTTGAVEGAIGPNNSPSTSEVRADMGVPDKNLLSIAGKGAMLFDPAALEFDVTIDADSLVFKFAFASEEYPEFLQYNDVFGLFISGVGLNNKNKDTTINLATLPDKITNVSVSSINHLNHSEYYTENSFEKDIKLFKTWQFDGFSKVLTASVKVKRNQKYHIKFAIADFADPYYDSAIFIDAFGVRTK